MKRLLALFASLAFASAYAEQFFSNYKDYYSQLPGVVFSEKPLEKPNGGYSLKNEHGLCGEEDSCQDYHGKIGQKNNGIHQPGKWRF